MFGKEFFFEFSKKNNYNFIATDLKELNIYNKDYLYKILLKIKPDIMINCVTYTNVEFCEYNFDLAKAINLDTVLYLAVIANDLQSILIHFSTDYVFDGNLNIKKLYTENMIPNSIKFMENKIVRGNKCKKKIIFYF